MQKTNEEELSLKDINHAPVRDVVYEKAVASVIERVKNTSDFSQESKDIIITALTKQIRKKLIRLDNGTIVRYRCPTCGHVYWIKSMLSCEHCGQLLIYGKEDEE